MKKHLPLIALLVPLLLGGCNVSETSNDKGEVSQENTSGSSSNHSSGSSNTDTGSHSGSGSSDPTSGTDTTTSGGGDGGSSDLGVKTIAQIKALCLEHVTDGDLNEVGLGYSNEFTVTLKAVAVDHFSLEKKKAPYGLLPFEKTIFADETGYIAVSGDYVFDKAKSYTDKRKSKFTLTGKLSRYFGIPELYVSGEEYTLDGTNTNAYNAFPISKETLSVTNLYTKFTNMPYNMAGHGYEDVYTVNNLKVVEKSDSNQFMVTDGYKMMKVICYDNLQEKSIYNMVGMITTQNWQPALRCLSYSLVTDPSVASSFPTDYQTSTDITVTNFKKIYASQDDTTTRMDSFINTFPKVYKATVYINYYLASGNYHLTCSDTYRETTDKNIIQSQITAHNQYGMIEFEDPDYTQKTIEQFEAYCPKYIVDAINKNVTVDIYFMPWQCLYSSKKPIWKVFVLNELLPNVIE